MGEYCMTMYDCLLNCIEFTFQVILYLYNLLNFLRRILELDLKWMNYILFNLDIYFKIKVITGIDLFLILLQHFL